jgi:hypothetical protein
MQQTGGELSFNPLKLTLTGIDLELSSLDSSAGEFNRSNPRSRHAEFDELTLDLLKRELSLNKGYLETSSISDLLTAERSSTKSGSTQGDSADELAEHEMFVDNWLQPLNWMFQFDSSHFRLDMSRQELLETLLGYAIRSASLASISLRLTNTDSLLFIEKLTASRSESSSDSLHNWSARASLNDRPFNLVVEPRQTRLGSIYYLDLRDLHFDAGAFENAGLSLPQIPGMADRIRILEGDIGLAGEMVVEYEGDRRSLTAIDLQLEMTGLLGQATTIDQAGAATILDFRNEALVVSVDQLQWLADSPHWKPERVRMASRVELDFISIGMPGDRDHVSSKSIAGDLLVDWSAGELVQLHSDRISARAIQASASGQLLPKLDWLFGLCRIPPPSQRFQELAIEFNSSIEIEDLSLLSDTCSARQLVIEGDSLRLAMTKGSDRLNPLALQSYRFAAVGLNSDSRGAGLGSLELTGTLGKADDGTDIGSFGWSTSMLDDRLEQLQLSVSGVRLSQLDLLSSWTRTLAGLNVRGSGRADAESEQTLSILAELERLDSEFVGRATVAPGSGSSRPTSASLEFSSKKGQPLAAALIEPLLDKVQRMSTAALQP